MTTAMSANGGAGWVMKVRDASVQIEKPLCSSSRPEPALLALLSSCGAMGLLNQVIAASRGHDLDVLHAVEHGKLANGCTIAPELVGMDGDWDVMFAQQPAEEGLGRLSVTVSLKENVQDYAVSIDRPPQPMSNAAHVHVHFVEMPPGTPSGFPVAEALGKLITELDAPRADGFTSHAYTPFQQEFFNISVAQREPVIEPHGIADHSEGEPVAGKLLTAQHRVTLPKQLAITLCREGSVPNASYFPIFAYCFYDKIWI